MQKTHNNCYGMKQYNMIFHQVNIGKHEFDKITAILKNAIFNYSNILSQQQLQYLIKSSYFIEFLMLPVYSIIMLT